MNNSVTGEKWVAFHWIFKTICLFFFQLFVYIHIHQIYFNKISGYHAILWYSKWRLFTSVFFIFSGLGYIVGSNVKNATGVWQYALRVRFLLFIFFSIYKLCQHLQWPSLVNNKTFYTNYILKYEGGLKSSIKKPL